MRKFDIIECANGFLVVNATANMYLNPQPAQPASPPFAQPPLAPLAPAFPKSVYELYHAFSTAQEATDFVREQMEKDSN